MKRDILKFLPLFILYLSLVIIFSSTTFQSDEAGYWEYATQISQGRAGETTLWWGPGYPIVLSPFVLFKLPLLAPKLLNAFLLFGSVIYFYKTLTLYIDNKRAIIFSWVLGLYPPLMREVNLLLSESLVFFLVCGFMFHLCKSHKASRNSRLHLAIAAVFLGYLALTKVFFGYVILAGLLSFLVLFIWRRTRSAKMILICLFAFVLCVPYLVSTYSRTGKIFYWGTSGGMSLYWMSTSYSTDELGSWFPSEYVEELPQFTSHRAFFQEISSLSDVEKDEAFKKQALENIIHFPKTYFVNWVANIGRLLFSYPFSFTSQKISTYFYIVPNMFIVVLFILSVYPAIRRWKNIPYEIIGLLLFDLIAFGGTTLLSAYDRQFRPLVPILLLWVSFVYVRVLKIDLRSETEIS